jgi:sigma-E factor negative regulatory protein RseA
MKADVSALMDGELEPDARARALEAVRQNAELALCWTTYHVIGDALRGVPGLSADCAARVSARLAEEPTVLAPAAAPAAVRARSPMRIVLPLAASVMGVAAVAWVAQSLNDPAPALVASAPAVAVPAVAYAPPSAAAQPVAAASARPEALARSTQVTQYLMAHQGHSPSMNGVASYVRTVSETRSGGAQ